jgi:hypothetical protein
MTVRADAPPLSEQPCVDVRRVDIDAFLEKYEC